MIKFDPKRIPRIPGDKEKKHTIMLVDDEEKILESLTCLLKEEYEIITASDSQEALDCIQKMEHPEKINLIISDQRMPGITGVELFRKLKEHIPKTIRIILTAFDDKYLLTDAVNNGIIHEFILKTSEPGDLKQKISNAIENLELRVKKDKEG
jgi:response regulator RpfG family c-di-GMP phosphodiesterase